MTFDLPEIFEYFEYRQFIKDIYLRGKKQDAGFSYRKLARKAGFKSVDYLSMILDNRNQQQESIIFPNIQLWQQN